MLQQIRAAGIGQIIAVRWVKHKAIISDILAKPNNIRYNNEKRFGKGRRVKQPTIFALSTAPVRAALAVIRLSGADCFAALKKLGIGDLPPPRYMGLRRLHHPKDKSMLDEALVVCFPAPASFTGEDMAELHVHGGMAVLHSILQALGDMDNLRLAEAGEFTRRAVGNGRLDLNGSRSHC